VEKVGQQSLRCATLPATQSLNLKGLPAPVNSHFPPVAPPADHPSFRVADRTALLTGAYCLAGANFCLNVLFCCLGLGKMKDNHGGLSQPRIIPSFVLWSNPLTMPINLTIVAGWSYRCHFL
jgi:hypothetical protein